MRWNIETTIEDDGRAKIRKCPPVNVKEVERRAEAWRENWKPVDRKFFNTTNLEMGF